MYTRSTRCAKTRQRHPFPKSSRQHSNQMLSTEFVSSRSPLPYQLAGNTLQHLAAAKSHDTNYSESSSHLVYRPPSSARASPQICRSPNRLLEAPRLPEAGSRTLASTHLEDE